MFICLIVGRSRILNLDMSDPVGWFNCSSCRLARFELHREGCKEIVRTESSHFHQSLRI